MSHHIFSEFDRKLAVLACFKRGAGAQGSEIRRLGCLSPVKIRFLEGVPYVAGEGRVEKDAWMASVRMFHVYPLLNGMASGNEGVDRPCHSPIWSLRLVRVQFGSSLWFGLI